MDMELWGKIDHILYLFSTNKISYQETREQIFVLFRDADYAQLAEDQVLARLTKAEQDGGK